MPKGGNTVKQTVRKYDFHMAKSLGQNFLTDTFAIEQIADACGAGPEDLVIEIGPGVGVLTRPLAERAGAVIAIEIDKKLIPILEKELADYPNVSILNEDVLKVNFDTLLAERKILPDGKTAEKVRIVGNLPYYITTPILLGLLEQRVPAESITVMVQKEVADRIVSPPGSKDYGVLSVSLQYYCSCEFVLDVPRESFLPQPNVDSAVVHLTLRRERVPVKSEAAFFELVKKSFSQRRKTLCNSLSGYHGFEKDEIARKMQENGIEPSRRAETLSVEEFARLADALMKD